MLFSLFSPYTTTNKREEAVMMKRFFWILLICSILTGCAAARQSEFAQHNSMYQSWGHMWYSWYGYKDRSCDPAVQEKSQREQWWGKTAECPK